MWDPIDDQTREHSLQNIVEIFIIFLVVLWNANNYIYICLSASLSNEDFIVSYFCIFNLSNEAIVFVDIWYLETNIL